MGSEGSWFCSSVTSRVRNWSCRSSAVVVVVLVVLLLELVFIDDSTELLMVLVMDQDSPRVRVLSISCLLVLMTSTLAW